MGTGISTLFPCLNPNRTGPPEPDDPLSPLDETLGHSFCYVRSSNHFLSPTPSDRFLSPSHSLRFEPALDNIPQLPTSTGFKTISGASVSANTSTPRTVPQFDSIYDDATSNNRPPLGFESSSSFASLPLQPVPRTGSGPITQAHFMSGPIERGALSGPLDQPNSNPDSNRVPFSAPLGGVYVKRKKRKGMAGIRKAFSRSFEKKRPWVVPVRNLVPGGTNNNEPVEKKDNVQWALGAAGEDRVHVVVSEEHGWLFVGIYDGFNGPDAPEFLMGNLYKAVYNHLQGLFWDNEENLNANADVIPPREITNAGPDDGNVKRVTFQSEDNRVRRRRLWEYLAEDDREDGLDLSGSDRFAFSVNDAICVSNGGSGASRRSLLLSRLKHGLIKGSSESKKLFPWRFWLEGKEEKNRLENRVEDDEVAEEEEAERGSMRRRRVGPVDHDSVLKAMSRALEVSEMAYLNMTDKFLDSNPELALMGSCLLVVLMREEDVYVMNLGDSRAIVAQVLPEEIIDTSTRSKGIVIDEPNLTEDIVEESIRNNERVDMVANKVPSQNVRLTALQLSTDHSTSIEEEVIRIKNEHPDDSHCIVNDRVKGRLKVTRAFGAGFLKQPKLNDALLEMFRNEYIGTAPYLSCIPSLRHHRLCPSDQFLVLSSDGLYQYFSNQEVVSDVENFMERFPDGDPAQHLIEELLLRAAKKAGMDLHELLDIPQGDRRKYHDDVTVMVISLEGRIWKSSGKYL